MWQRLKRPSADAWALYGLAGLVAAIVALNFVANWTIAGVISQSRLTSRANGMARAVEIAQVAASATTKQELKNSVTALAMRHRIGVVRFVDSDGRDGMAPIVFDQSVSEDTLWRTVALSSQSAYDYHRNPSSDLEIVSAPVGQSEESELGELTIVMLSRNESIASLERAGIALAVMGLFAAGLLASLVVLIYRAATKPLHTIRERVSTAGFNSPDTLEAVGEMTGAYQIAIHELQAREVELKEAHNRLQVSYSDLGRLSAYLMNSFGEGVILLDGVGNLLGINALAVSRLELGISPGDFSGAGKSDDYVGLFSERSQLKWLVDDALLRGEAAQVDIERLDLNGGALTIRCSAITLAGSGDSSRSGPSGIIILVTDQSEVSGAQKRVELSRQLASLGEMAAGLAHQLRNSISAAMGFGSLALKKATAPEASVASAVEALMKELKSEAELVDRFLSFARPLEVALTRVDLAEFLADSLSGFFVKPEISSRVAFLVAPENRMVEIDQLLMKQVVVNLIDNALNATPITGQPVEVSALDGDAGATIIRIRDFGTGVKIADREKIFTPFFSTSPSGAGLGLPLARKIVEMHGGRLAFQSLAGVGTTFEVTLPLQGDTSSSALPSQASAEATSLGSLVR